MDVGSGRCRGTRSASVTPRAGQDALRECQLDNRREHLAIIGANGSGRPLLTLILAGRAPTPGIADQHGGLGKRRHRCRLAASESQSWGHPVADDVGPPGYHC